MSTWRPRQTTPAELRNLQWANYLWRPVDPCVPLEKLFQDASESATLTKASPVGTSESWSESDNLPPLESYDR